MENNAWIYFYTQMSGLLDAVDEIKAAHPVFFLAMLVASDAFMMK